MCLYIFNMLIILKITVWQMWDLEISALMGFLTLIIADERDSSFFNLALQLFFLFKPFWISPFYGVRSDCICLEKKIYIHTAV